ncbi:hypothetical protein E2C01_062137 [Portunus trituberculatus]|uniref:Uncharacterized protein n=1 Tax=Portunus trituberculatus TaxID=210409 RepID=A0A5B7H749_PORTR|nr:hypothetical protein [Portunus trituberculatus]
MLKCWRCQVYANLKDHNNSLEHLLVSHFMKVRCCGRHFPTRAELEEHRLSLQHYRYVHRHKGADTTQELEEEEEEKERKVATAVEVIQEAHRKHQEGEDPPVTSTTLPPYDPDTPVGLHLIQTRSFYKCSVCPENKLKLTNEMLIKTHFHSILHYNNLCDHILQLAVSVGLGSEHLSSRFLSPNEVRLTPSVP